MHIHIHIQCVYMYIYIIMYIYICIQRERERDIHTHVIIHHMISVQLISAPVTRTPESWWLKPWSWTLFMTSGSLFGLQRPSTRRLPETARFFPAISQRVTALESPGSKRMEAPEGTLRR